MILPKVLTTRVAYGLADEPGNQTSGNFRPGREVELLDNPTALSRETILPGFILNLEPIR